MNVLGCSNNPPKYLGGCSTLSRFAAVIIENRFDVSEVIEAHTKMLNSLFTESLHFKTTIKTIQQYNEVLTSVEFWSKLLDYDKVLIFQHDSMLLRKGIQEFMGYDYVGAPWKFQDHGGNGGLSIRNPKAMLACIEKQPWNPKIGNEDVYFSNLLKDMPEYKLAPREVCRKFSCESIFQLGTLGYHAIDKYLTDEEVIQIKTQYE